jgi:hydrogenase maturation factor
MKAFLAAAVVAVVLGYGAYYVLTQNYQQPSHAVFTTEGARVGDPGSNLIRY